MAKKTMNVGIIGYNFMGRAHSQAWLNAPRYFDVPIETNLKVACGRSEKPLKDFADRWGWQETATDWRKVVERDDIDIVDISVPTALHRDVVVAAAKAGKHIFCEKPCALNSKQATEMLAAAEEAGVVHYLNHNYRRCPAVVLAKQFIDDGRLGDIYHWRGAYLQSWIVDPNFPLTWQLQAESAGAGPHADLNSHSIDLARYLVGDVKAVAAMKANFITERPLPAAGATAFQGGSKGGKTGKVTVEDALFMVAEFANGAIGSFEASRFALGRENYNMFEIYGSRGAVAFNLERMNELQYFSEDDPSDAQGFRTIIATEPNHPYVSHWWPPGHIIGYEHEFTHAVADFLQAVDKGEAIRPNLEDGVKIMQVIDAGLESAATGRRVELPVK